VRRVMVPSPFLRMVAGVASTQALVAVITVIVTGTLAARLGPDEFGGYLLARRTSALLLSLCALPVGVATARYVALVRDETERRAYLLGALVLSVLPALLVLAVGMTQPHMVASLLFRGAEGRGLLIGCLWLLVGMSCGTVYWSYHLGLGRTGRANLCQLFGLGIGPAAVVYSPVVHAGVGRMLLLMGLVGCMWLGPLLITLGDGRRFGNVGSGLPRALSDLSRYAVPRIPGGFALTGLLAFGSFLASRHGRMAEAGALLATQIIFQIAQLVASAFGYVLLPKIAALHSQGRSEFIGDRVSDIISFVGHIGLFFSLHLWVWSRPLLLTWLGAGYSSAVPLMRVQLAALIPYFAYIMLRSVIDAIESKPVNTINLCWSLLATAIGCVLSEAYGLGGVGLAASTTVGVWVVAALSVAFLWTRYRITGQYLMLGWAVGLNAALVLPSMSAAGFLQQRLSGVVLLAVGAPVEALLLVSYCLLLWRLHARWATELMTRIVPAAPSVS
jgi:O-antigen/teichoic acid export membrane protein